MNANFLTEEFSRVRAGLPGAKSAQYDLNRDTSLRKFIKQGFPTTDMEEWRYTNMEPVSQNTFRLAERTQLPDWTPQRVAETVMCGPETYLMVFVNGFFAPELSRMEGCEAHVVSLSQALGSENETIPTRWKNRAETGRLPLVDLNDAFFTDGALVRIPDSIPLSKPLYIVWISAPERTPTVQYPKAIVVLGARAQVQIVETHICTQDGSYFSNAVTEIVLGEGAGCDHYRIQREGKNACHAGFVNVLQKENSRYESFSLSVGARLSRTDIEVVLDGEGADCTLNGLYETQDNQHVDNHTVIEHAKPHGTSRELYKGIMRGQSRAVFNGRIQVEPDAQKTDAIQYNKNLMLSDQSWVHTQPELKILANDVKCKHGATIGQMNPDMLFYLRSRGIPETEAKNILVRAFASEMIESIKLEPLRDGLIRFLAAEQS